MPEPSPLPVFWEYGTSIGTMVAAFAAAVAAGAAVRQARRSTAAARDALEALGRVLRPERLEVAVWPGNREPGDYTVPDEWPGTLRVRVHNRGGFTAENVMVSFTDSAGKRWPDLGPAAIASGEPCDLDLEQFVPALPDPPPPDEWDWEKTSAQHTLVLTFSDRRELLDWRQTFTVREHAVWRTDKLTPVVQRMFKPTPTGPPVLVRRPR